MPYLTIDLEQIRKAWEESAKEQLDESELIFSVEEQLDYGRRAVAIHIPQSWPHGMRCHNCNHPYPCRIILWGMTLLRARGWDLPDVIDLLESIQGGGRP